MYGQQPQYSNQYQYNPAQQTQAMLQGQTNPQAYAQQAMQQSQQGMPAADPPGTDDPSPNMVTERLAALERLAGLRDSGALTDAEFEAEKAKVLAGG